MASVLIMSKLDEGAPLALQMRNERHLSKFYAQDPLAGEMFSGCQSPARILKPTKMLDQFDLILSTTPFVEDEEHLCQSYGKTLIGGGVLAAALCEGDYQNNLLEAVYSPEPDPLLGYPLLLTALFNGEKFLPQLMVSRVYPRFMNGERGVVTGEAGYANVLVKEGRVFARCLQPLEAFLKRSKFKGILTIPVILTEEDMQVTWITATLYPPLLQGLVELVHMPLFDILWTMVNGEETKLRSEDVSICTQLSVPPYPLSADCTLLQGQSFISPEKEALPHLWLRDVMEVNGVYAMQGISGVLGYVSARGNSVKECRRRIERTIKNSMPVPDVQWRDDIGYDFDEQRDWLRRTEWAL